MSRMPCKCTGFRVDKCKCKVLRTGYRTDETSSVVLLTQSNSLCRLLDLKERNNSNFVAGLVENMYESCAGYNLRYCPIRGFVKHNDSYFRHTVKDLIIIICFLLANFVVFLTIITKMMVHMYFMCRITVKWIRRSFLTKLDTKEETVPLSPAQMYHECSPPIMNKYQ